jgi:DNA-binding HxlR family transcriptional regulator
MVDPAELFEAISHPERIKILKILSKKPSSFASLKRQLGIQSSGNLDYHLKKLRQLVKVQQDGLYGLTDAGKEALLSIEAIEMWTEKKTRKIRIARKIPKEVLFLGLLEICATVSVFLFSAIAHVPSQWGYLPPVGVLLGGFYSAFGLFTQQKWSWKIILAKSALVISMSLFLLNYLEQPSNVASSDSIYYLAFVAVEIVIVVLTLRRPLKDFLGIKEAARISFPVMIGGLLCIFSGILLIILQITQHLNNEFNMFNFMNDTTILCGLTIIMGGVFILLRIYVLSNLGALMSIIFGLLPPSQHNALNISAFHAFDLISNGTYDLGPYTYWVAGLVGSLPIVGGAIALVSMRKILE